LPRTCALSRTWQIARAGIDPRFLLEARRASVLPSVAT
jgi:hypothetical protein